jgi:hypothetical protein
VVGLPPADVAPGSMLHTSETAAAEPGPAPGG